MTLLICVLSLSTGACSRGNLADIRAFLKRVGSTTEASNESPLHADENIGRDVHEEDNGLFHLSSCVVNSLPRD